MPRGGYDIPVSGTHLKGTQWLRRVDPTVGHLKGTPWSRRVWTPQIGPLFLLNALCPIMHPYLVYDLSKIVKYTNKLSKSYFM